MPTIMVCKSIQKKKWHGASELHDFAVGCMLIVILCTVYSLFIID